MNSFCLYGSNLDLTYETYQTIFFILTTFHL